MAKIDYLLQGISERNHKQVFSEILSIDNIKKVVISVAFIKGRWLSLIDECLNPYYHITEIYAGIRNEITSVQAILGLLKRGIKPYLVDTGTSSFIFHPKIFLVYSDIEARIVIGSANATSGGFYKNIEASTIIYLDLRIKDDYEFLHKVLQSIDTLLTYYPENVIKILTEKEAIQAFHEGRLADERLTMRPLTTTKKLMKDPKLVPKMKLKDYGIGEPKAYFKKMISKSKTNSWILLWESSPLTERDLNIPTGKNTHRTGSMNLSKGNMENIDQRHHFRDVVFNDLEWHFNENPSKKHIENVDVSFEIIIKGISYGIYKLMLIHNTRKDTATYIQRNSVTAIRWGNARNIIARPDLIDHILRLYKTENNSNEFIISID